MLTSNLFLFAIALINKAILLIADILKFCAILHFCNIYQ